MQNLDKLISELKKTKESLKADKKEPHKDDPKHEQKEQEKAKKIKKEAQSLLDLHKEEMDKGEPNGGMSSNMGSSVSPTAPNTNGTPPIMKRDKMDLVVKAQDVFDTLVKNGHTESALLLRNWGEEDSLAKSCRAELEKSNKVGRLNGLKVKEKASGIAPPAKRAVGRPMTDQEKKAASAAQDLVATQKRYDGLHPSDPIRANVGKTLVRLGGTIDEDEPELSGPDQKAS